MGKSKLRGKDLIKIGYPEGPAIGQAIQAMEKTKAYKNLSKEEKLEILAEVLASPELFLEDKALAAIALLLMPVKKPEVIELQEPKNYHMYGVEVIDYDARRQMDVAVQLPIAVSGALMPDAHHGYGLPIGGVLATDNAVIPYGVGVDIGCRMSLSVFNIEPQVLERYRENWAKILGDCTRFGQDVFDKPKDDAILTRAEFSEIPIKGLIDKAYKQIGSSGGGNHFVEFGIVELFDDNELGMPAGKYIGLLSHSGSRGMGAAIAQYYTDLARKTCPLPKYAQHLAWLSLDSEEGQAYWKAMTLAGDYASACHHQIHWRIAKALGEQRRVVIENHHNFAWKERLGNGKEVIVHRKGATPAGKGVLGIIPGSMTAPGFIVRGRGIENALFSASHGAGRAMSRSKAKSTLTKSYVAEHLAENGVTVIGGGVDEAPMAYKDIHQVMSLQQELVDVLGKFQPRIVRMCGE